MAYSKPNELAIIVAVDEDGGFGKDGIIPWLDQPFTKKDLTHFKKLTNGSICIMGRRTYDDMLNVVCSRTGKQPEQIEQILPGRKSYVVTSDPTTTFHGAETVTQVRQVFNQIQDGDPSTVFVLGGERLFKETLSMTDLVYMTIIPGRYECDVRFPVETLSKNFVIVDGSKEDPLRFVTYRRSRTR